MPKTLKSNYRQFELSELLEPVRDIKDGNFSIYKASKPRSITKYFSVEMVMVMVMVINNKISKLGRQYKKGVI